MPRAKKSKSKSSKTSKLSKRFDTPKQPPAPIISFKISPHGVSGYPTTGVPGAYDHGFSTTGFSSGNIHNNASRYSIQALGSTVTIKQGTNSYTQVTPARLPSVNTTSSFTAEPFWESRMEGSTAAATLPRNQYLQSRGGSASSRINERASVGFLDNDLALQQHVASIDNSAPVRQFGDMPTPVQPTGGTRLSFTPVTAPRQDNQNSGTINNVDVAPSTGPQGQDSLHQINDAHTPQVTAVGYSGAGTHPAHGPSPQQFYDGSWTLDVLPPSSAPIGLMNLPPAADIPVQTYSGGGGPRNTSVAFSRASGGVNAQPSVQTVAVFA